MPLCCFEVEQKGGYQRQGYQRRLQLEQRLEDWLDSNKPTQAFVLWGLGGSGKSTLARTFAARLAEDDGTASIRIIFCCQS